jgi:hypothetical protein
VLQRVCVSLSILCCIGSMYVPLHHKSEQNAQQKGKIFCVWILLPLQGAATEPIRSEDDAAEVTVNLVIPAAQPGFTYIPVDLEVQIIEFNNTSLNRGFVVHQHFFNGTVPQKRRKLRWESPAIQRVCTPNKMNERKSLFSYVRT